MKKSFILVLAIIMAITCLFAGCGEPEAKVAGVPEEPGKAKNKVAVSETKGKEYTTIEFGRYPSKELSAKKDADLVSSLEKLTDKDIDASTGYYKHDGKLYQKEIKIVKDEDGADVEVPYWFEVTPIKWIVLEKKDGKMLVVAEDNVTAMAFNSTPGDMDWSLSTLRDWLNNFNDYKDKINFYNSAFNADEKSTIITQEIKSTNGGDAVKDRVTIFSLEDLNNSKWSDGLFEADKDGLTLGRACGNTDYAKFKGAVATNTYDRTNSSWYWLRNNGINAQHAAYVNEMGDIIVSGYNVAFPQIGVRPVLLLDTNNFK